MTIASELVADLRDLTAPEYIDGRPSASPRDQVLLEAADWLESLQVKNAAQAARIAELERRLRILTDSVIAARARIAELERELGAEYQSRSEWAIEQEQELATWTRQLEAAQACIVAADAMRVELRACVTRNCVIAYDAARAAIAKGGPT